MPEFDKIDIQFANFLQRLAHGPDPNLFAAAALLSQSTRAGHTCLSLESAARDAGAFFGGKALNPDAWIKSLEKNPVVGKPGDFSPIILDHSGRLYLHRYYENQNTVANCVKARSIIDMKNQDLDHMRRELDRLFPCGKTNETDWQKIAAATAVLRKFCIISGGPGCGKTTTVAKILALIFSLQKNNPPAIALAAPTGRAAARLMESLEQEISRLNIPKNLKDNLPKKALTIHRLLWAGHGLAGFSKNKNNPLAIDTLIIDEASMVDLALMASLVDALPKHARLILLGDKDQLASVAPGSVLGDLCLDTNPLFFSKSFAQILEKATGENISLKENVGQITDSIVQLRKNYRFALDSGIGAIANAVVDNQPEKVVAAISKHPEIIFTDLKNPGDVQKLLAPYIATGFADYMSAATPEQSLKKFGRFRILCAVRQGPFGVYAANRLTESVLANKGLLRPKDFPWYEKRPIVINKNDYSLDLFNGDTGCFINNKAVFSGSGQKLRQISKSMLPEHETAFAMTVHKSQGSEFDSILLILPEQASPVLTQELVYTAITRARNHLHIAGTISALESAVKTPTSRPSGLADAISIISQRT